MEWEAPAIVLDARAHGESGALVTVLTEQHGAYRALARGGGSRGQASLWQRGNIVQARWVARLADQLGNISAELLHAGAAETMNEPLPLAILTSACAVAEGALPEREPHPRSFIGLVHILDTLSSIETADLLRELVPGFASGALRPFPIRADSVYRLEDAAEAYRTVLGSSRDRVILRPAGEG